jgi:hypothetical protein
MSEMSPNMGRLVVEDEGVRRGYEHGHVTPEEVVERQDQLLGQSLAENAIADREVLETGVSALGQRIDQLGDPHGRLMDQAIAGGMDQAEAFSSSREELSDYVSMHLHEPGRANCHEPDAHYPEVERPGYPDHTRRAIQEWVRDDGLDIGDGDELAFEL